MSNPRYRPRDYAFDDLDFGRDDGIRWRSPEQLVDDETEDQLAAAILQHRVSIAVRRAREARFMSVAELAERMGATPYRTRAVLNGDVVMRLEDLAAMQRVLAVELLQPYVRPDGPAK